ncbi:MAG: DUF2975 domain-containing protein [Bacteroidales bacterium]|nr:DUF2975 domain-containing protein [Bacteroidales bacterium]
MEQKNHPLSIRIILFLTNLGLGLLALFLLVIVIVNIVLYTNMYNENIGISIPLPVEIDFLQTGKINIGDKISDFKFSDSKTELSIKNAPSTFTRSAAILALIVILFSAYLLSIFRNFILNVKRGKTFSMHNILLIKKLAYGLSFFWLFAQLYTILIDYFIVSHLEYEQIDIKYQLINYPEILILALFIWVIAHVFSTGLKLQEEQDLTV